MGYRSKISVNYFITRFAGFKITFKVRIDFTSFMISFKVFRKILHILVLQIIYKF